MTDFEKLIEKLKHKDEEAFTTVYNETKNGVYGIILSILKDRMASEDIMQDVYLTILEKINYYKIGTNFRTWVLTIARNKAIDYYRKNKREVLVDPNSDYMFGVTEAGGERNLLIDEVLDSFSQEERQIFLLKIVDNLKHREISKIMNMPLGTVIWHYNKSVKKINKMKESNDEEK